MHDWEVWPIFVIQLVTFLLFFFPRDKILLGLKTHTWVILFILLSCIAIALSLYHDSMTTLKLYF